MMMVPFITLLLTVKGFPAEHIIKMAVATSLATICFTSVSSVRAQHARGAVRWDIVRLLAPGIVVGSMLGAQIAKWLPSSAMALFFALFVGFSATQMLLDLKPHASRQLPQPPGMVAAGGLIGLLAALVGAGGAFISVPFMVASNVAIHKRGGHLGRARLSDRARRHARLCDCRLVTRPTCRRARLAFSICRHCSWSRWPA